MKFEYDVKDDALECVAFIDYDGDLWIKTDNGSCLMFNSEYTPSNGDLWEEYRAVHKFYHGDTITITF